MRIIFLDFDGVLNSATFLLANPGGMDQLDPAAVARLNTIIDRTGAKVVISSTWRLLLSPPELGAWLADLGFKGEIIDYTPAFSPGTAPAHGLLFPRCQEINAWIQAQAAPIESFVVLDDADLDDAHLGELAGHIVKTDFTAGLLDEHIEWAISVLHLARGDMKGARGRRVRGVRADRLIALPITAQAAR